MSDHIVYWKALPGTMHHLEQTMPAAPVFRCLPILALLAAQNLWADYRAEDDFYGEAPIVLTVSRMDKPLAESPASVSVIDRQMIRDSGATTLAEVLRLAPGMILGYFYDNAPVVTYQGLGARWMRRLQVLIDGRSVFVPSYGGVPWNNLPVLLDDIERIEITRGPNAVTYGANAFLATINIITRHSAEDLGHAASATGSLDRDSGIAQVYYRYGGNNEDLDWRISLGHEEDAGYSMLHDSKQVDKINLRLDYLSAYNRFWSLMLGYSTAGVGLGRGQNTDPLRRETTKHGYFNGSWEAIDTDVTSRVRLTLTRQDVGDDYQTGALNQLLSELSGNPGFLTLPDITTHVDLGRDSSRSEIELYQNRQLSPVLHINYGFSLRYDQVASRYLFNDNNTHTQRLSRLFSSMEWRFATCWLLDTGLMIEDSDKTDPSTSGRLSLVRLMGDHSLRMVLSKANRNPILWEVEGETQFSVELPSPLNQTYYLLQYRADPDLATESILSREIGLYSQWMGGRMTTDIKLFHYRIEDQIIGQETTLDPDPATGQPQTFDIPVNKGNTRASGIEAAFNYSAEDGRIRWFGGYSLVTSESNELRSSDSYPRHIGFVGGHVNINPKQQISGVWYHIGRFSWYDRNAFTDSYDKLDLRWSYLLDPDHALRLELIGKNLAGNYDDYIRYKHEPAWVMRLSGEF